MLFDKIINREVNKRLHEEMTRRAMEERLDHHEKRLEELRYRVKCLEAQFNALQDGLKTEANDD